MSATVANPTRNTNKTEADNASGHLSLIGKSTEKAQLLPSNPLSADEKTPDKWVPRDERLIRLTGIHPFNSEPPLTTLYEHGFITSPSLHFVRNHGPVAQATEEEIANWSISVEGLVENPRTVSLDQLKRSHEPITLPVTSTCAGNRRKEQNMVKKSKGFNWGAGGTSTSFWTGALLCDVSKDLKPQKSARYVIFEGHETSPNGKYSTGIRIQWARDFDRGILLAWAQNGKPSAPDHGRPVRVVIPGVIGGRSVKWLRRIIFSDQPPDGWYHKYDNRVIPTTISTEESSKSEEWWTDQRYAIYNLNSQSIIVVPEHNSTLAKNTISSTYKLKGFAYNGGGIKVSRVEVSLNAGRTWNEAKLRYIEDELRDMNATGQLDSLYGGKIDLADRYLSFCWCFWELDSPTESVLKAEDIVVRAMDLNMVAQPRDMYWSVLGMLGNWWYRLTIVNEDDHVKFSHPTNLHANDGWMDKMKAENKDPSQWFAGMKATLPKNEADSKKEGVKMTRDDKVGIPISKAELKSHENWFVVNGQVYDGTNFLSHHPGGVDSIKMASGEDVTEEFMAIHSDNAKQSLARFQVGTLDTSQPNRSKEENVQSSDEEPGTVGSTFSNPKQWKTMKLLKHTKVSTDVHLFEFGLESPDQKSGLYVGGHIFVRKKNQEDETVIRAYTPLSCHRTEGILVLLVKVYSPTPRVPGGKMGTILECMQIGDTVDVKGPVGSFKYLGKGEYLYHGEKSHAKKSYMVSGGSGITPCYQILKEVAFDKGDPTYCHLLFCNRDHEDIICYEDSEAFKDGGQGRIVIDYFLSRPNDITKKTDFSYKLGRIDHDILSSVVEKELSHKEALLMVCGPPGLVELVKSWTKKHDIPKNRLVIF